MNAIKGRVLAIGIAIVFVGTVRAMDAAGIEGAIGNCLLAAVIASLLTWGFSS